MTDHPYPAPAKLNLFLHIVGRRPDGYHLLESVFVLTDLSDALRIERRADSELIRTGDIVGTPQKDLCVRAAKALREATGCHQGAEIDVLKRIPSAAGLGGGSSDAATVLLVLNQLWGLELPLERLMGIGQALGADVPFFLFGRSAFARGIGEVLEPVDVPVCVFALAMPSRGTDTAAVYASPLLKRDTPSIPTERYLIEQRRLWPKLFGTNDMQRAALETTPEIGLALDSLGGDARMTGSGSAVFRPFPTAEAAREAVGRLPRSLRGHILELLPRHPLCQRLG